MTTSSSSSLIFFLFLVLFPAAFLSSISPLSSPPQRPPDWNLHPPDLTPNNPTFSTQPIQSVDRRAALSGELDLGDRTFPLVPVTGLRYDFLPVTSPAVWVEVFRDASDCSGSPDVEFLLALPDIIRYPEDSPSVTRRGRSFSLFDSCSLDDFVSTFASDDESSESLFWSFPDVRDDSDVMHLLSGFRVVSESGGSGGGNVYSYEVENECSSEKFRFPIDRCLRSTDPEIGVSSITRVFPNGFDENTPNAPLHMLDLSDFQSRRWWMTGVDTTSANRNVFESGQCAKTETCSRMLPFTDTMNICDAPKTNIKTGEQSTVFRRFRFFPSCVAEDLLSVVAINRLEAFLGNPDSKYGQIECLESIPYDDNLFRENRLLEAKLHNKSTCLDDSFATSYQNSQRCYNATHTMSVSHRNAASYRVVSTDDVGWYLEFGNPDCTNLVSARRIANMMETCFRNSGFPGGYTQYGSVSSQLTDLKDASLAVMTEFGDRCHESVHWDNVMFLAGWDCYDSEVTLLEISVLRHSEEQCLVRSTRVVRHYQVLPDSYRFSCEKGEMFVDKFVGPGCNGEYQREAKQVDEIYCLTEDEYFDDLSIVHKSHMHFGCITLRCGTHSEFDPNVCSGSGKCTAQGCECNLLHTGDLCERNMVVAVFVGAGFGSVCLCVILTSLVVLTCMYWRLRSSLPENVALHREGTVIPLQVFRSDVIGEGTFATVCRGELQISDDKTIPVAVKTYRHGIDRPEVSVLVMLEHDNILQCYGGFWMGDGHSLALEFCNGGNLARYLRLNPHKLSMLDRLRILRQVAAGVSYLHSKSIIHRDLKPENLLIQYNEDDKDTEGEKGFLIKISDFGLSRRLLVGSSDNPSVEVCGTPGYIAPELREIALQSPSDEDVFVPLKKADVYSFGILGWEIWHAAVAYSDLREKFKDNVKGFHYAIHRRELRPNWPVRESNEIDVRLCRLCQNCWQTKPLHRPSFDEIEHRLDDMIQLAESTGRSADESVLIKVPSRVTISSLRKVPSLRRLDDRRKKRIARVARTNGSGTVESSRKVTSDQEVVADEITVTVPPHRPKSGRKIPRRRRRKED